MNKENCSNRIKKALMINKMTQSQLCEMTSIPKSAMSQYISGAFEPKQDRVFAISKALNVSEAWLMGYNVPMDRETSNSKSEKSYDLLPAYLSFAKDAQDNGINPDDINTAIEMIRKLRGDE